MKRGAPESFAATLKSQRERAGYTQDELATIAGLSVHAVSALERGERTRPHVETVRALCAALDLRGAARDALMASARAPLQRGAVDELNRAVLPVPPTPILGRDSDLHTIGRWLADPALRLLTMVGPGGVGKTRLALEVARHVDEHDSMRVVFVALAVVAESSLIASAVSDALGLADVAAGDLPRRVRAAGADRPLLLVLDNCEHLSGVTPFVADLMATTGRIRILATSRAPLHIRGEQQHTVAPLAMQPTSASPADRATAPAVQLFVERIRDCQPDFRLTPANSAVVTAICQRLDALPLALELAAPWVRVLAVEHLLERLEHDVLLSALGPLDLPVRQQTINATVAWSYRLLDAGDRRAFRLLGAVPGPFSLEGAAAVLGTPADPAGAPTDPLPMVASLVDKSLLTRVEGARNRPLYQMLETVRAWARLEASTDERDAVAEALTRHCAREVSLAADRLTGPAQPEWLDRIRDEFDTYRFVVSRLIDRDRHSEAGEIAFGLALFFLIRGYTTEGLQWYTRILNGSALAAPAEAKALAGAGLMRWAKGDFAAARDQASCALALAAGATELIVLAESMLGHIESGAGNLQAARDHYARSAEGYEALAIPWGRGTSLGGLAGVALAAGEIREAERLLNEATRTLQGAGVWFLTPVLCFRAVLAVHRGDADGAIALMQESLTHIRLLQDRFAFVYALVPLARAATLKGEHAWAARLLGARDAVAESTGATIVDHAVQRLRDDAEREARSHLGAGEWARAYAAGRIASIDSLSTAFDLGG